MQASRCAGRDTTFLRSRDPRSRGLPGPTTVSSTRFRRFAGRHFSHWAKVLYHRCGAAQLGERNTTHCSMQLVYDSNDLEYANRRGDLRLDWLRDLGAIPIDELTGDGD